MIADEDLALYPGAVPVEEVKKAKTKPEPNEKETADEQPKVADEKAAEEPKNKARKSAKNKTKVEE